MKIKDACEGVGISPRTFRRWIARGIAQYQDGLNLEYDFRPFAAEMNTAIQAGRQKRADRKAIRRLLQRQQERHYKKYGRDCPQIAIQLQRNKRYL